MSKRKKYGAWLLFVTLLSMLLAVAQLLLVPHDRASNPEAFLMQEAMEASGEQNDVIFIGDCEVYESFSPTVLWQEYGVESRVYGTPQQLPWHSYAVLSSVLDESTPRVVVLGIYGFIYNEPQSEAYNRMALEALPLNGATREAIRVGKTADETALSYALPLLRYHDRYSQLTWQDVTSLLEKPARISSRGYLVQTDVLPAKMAQPSHEGALPPREDAFGEMALYYFDRIVSLCREKGTSLVLIKAPTDSWRYPWHAEYEERARVLADEYGLPYYNFLDDFDEIGLDMRSDSYDAGLHLNVAGAEKLTAHFGRILTENYELDDRRADAARVEAWRDEIAFYEQAKEREGESQ